jgi:hypothetical protein
MKEEVRNALLEWLAGMLVGAIPLLGHAAMWVAIKQGVGDTGNWAVDFLFVGITASGSSVVSAVLRLIKRIVPLSAMTVGLGCLLTVNLVMLVPEAAMYGLISSGAAQASSVWYSLGLLAGSSFCAMIFELVLANRAG